MLTFAAAVCTALMIFAIFLLFFGLPGTWIILIIIGLWSCFVENSAFSLSFFLLWGGIALVGELIEFAAGYFGTKKFGGSTKGSIGGMVGGLIGAILFAPLFFGFGALLGALAGGFTGCFLVERLRGTPTEQSIKAAWGTTLGRFGGFLIKITIAVIMIWNAIPLVWQSVI